MFDLGLTVKFAWDFLW